MLSHGGITFAFFYFGYCCWLGAIISSVCVCVAAYIFLCVSVCLTPYVCVYVRICIVYTDSYQSNFDYDNTDQYTKINMIIRIYYTIWQGNTEVELYSAITYIQIIIAITIMVVYLPVGYLIFNVIRRSCFLCIREFLVSIVCVWLVDIDNDDVVKRNCIGFVTAVFFCFRAREGKAVRLVEQFVDNVNGGNCADTNLYTNICSSSKPIAA